ncbi:MAG: hypothetical protein ACYTGH_05755, partial [Planctomycetota bacterium]
MSARRTLPLILLLPLLCGCLSPPSLSGASKKGRRSGRDKGNQQDLMQELEASYAELQSLQATMAENRRREGEQLRALQRTIRGLRDRVERTQKRSSTHDTRHPPVTSADADRSTATLSPLGSARPPHPAAVQPNSRPAKTTENQPPPPPFLQAPSTSSTP